MKKTVKQILADLVRYYDDPAWAREQEEKITAASGETASFMDLLIYDARKAVENCGIRYLVSTGPGSSLSPDGWDGYNARYTKRVNNELPEDELVYGYEQALEHINQVRSRTEGEYAAHWRNCPLKIVTEETFYAEVSDHPGEPTVEVGSLEIGDVVRRQYAHSNFARYDWTILDITPAGDVLLMDEEGKQTAYHKTTPVLLMRRPNKGEVNP